jgi:hypothetical protein
MFEVRHILNSYINVVMFHVLHILDSYISLVMHDLLHILYSYRSVPIIVVTPSVDNYISVSPRQMKVIIVQRHVAVYRTR